MWAAHASVLRETNATMRRELACFDPANGRFDEATVLAALFLRNGCLQILNLGMIFPHDTTNATSEIPLIQE